MASASVITNFSVGEVVVEVDINHSYSNNELNEQMGRKMQEYALQMYQKGYEMKDITIAKLTGFIRVRFVFVVDRYDYRKPDKEEELKEVSIDDYSAKLKLNKEFSLQEVMNELKYQFLSARGKLVFRENNTVLSAGTLLPGIKRIKINMLLSISNSNDFKDPEVSPPAPVPVPPPTLVAVTEQAENVNVNAMNPVSSLKMENEAEIEGFMVYGFEHTRFHKMWSDDTFAVLKKIGNHALRLRWGTMKKLELNNPGAAQFRNTISEEHYQLFQVVEIVRREFLDGIVARIYERSSIDNGRGHWITALHTNDRFKQLYNTEVAKGSALGNRMLSRVNVDDCRALLALAPNPQAEAEEPNPQAEAEQSNPEAEQSNPEAEQSNPEAEQSNPEAEQ